MLCINAILVATCHAMALPPIGAVYERNVMLPVFGSQHFRLRILTRHKAAIQLTGAFHLDEECLHYDATEDGMAFDLGPDATSLLRTFKTTIQKAEYQRSKDCASIFVKPPWIPTMKIQLHRVPTDLKWKPRRRFWQRSWSWWFHREGRRRVARALPDDRMSSSRKTAS